jgi:hypothetical protein
MNKYNIGAIVVGVALVTGLDILHVLDSREKERNARAVFYKGANYMVLDTKNPGVTVTEYPYRLNGTRIVDSDRDGNPDTVSNPHYVSFKPTDEQVALFKEVTKNFYKTNLETKVEATQ